MKYNEIPTTGTELREKIEFLSWERLKIAISECSESPEGGSQFEGFDFKSRYYSIAIASVFATAFCEQGTDTPYEMIKESNDPIDAVSVISALISVHLPLMVKYEAPGVALLLSSYRQGKL